MSAQSSTPEPKAKIEGLVYENRQHCIGNTMLIQSAHDYLMVGPTGKKNAKDESTSETKQDKTTDTKSNRNRKRKKVTFRKDSELVSIREISPRPNRSDSSDNCCDTSSSDSDSSDSDSSSSEEDSNEDDDDDSNLVNKVAKIVLKHTRGNSEKSTKGVIITRPILPRPPRLRRPRASKPPAKRPPDKPTNPASPVPNKSETLKPSKPSTLTATGRKYGRSLIMRRPQSCTENRERLKQRPPSPILTRASSARASLSLSSTNRAPQEEGSIRRRIASASSAMMRVTPQSERYASLDTYNNTNSGQERTKFYAWQVANGAPLVTTPGIAPMYSEQVTLTRL